MAVEPESYLRQTPVWRFSSFDWNGPWGSVSVTEHAQTLQRHISQHLSSFETMYWADILAAAGGRKHGTNNHEIDRIKFTKAARDRFAAMGILADKIMSLRLDQATRVYGIRNGNCLQILFFDPYHTDPNRCCYDFS